ncbi:MAG: DUF2924 domain-containing protein [Wolbachia endosymbiont of Xenopsylla cheopis]
MDTSVIKEVMSLESKTLVELREMWRRLFNTDSPPYSKRYLIPRIAYRLQEMIYGRLSDKAEKKLDYLADQMEQGKKINSQMSDQPISGTRLIRQYRGVEHEVIVTDIGFVYKGQQYKSLSKIAGKITGNSYNGPAFFGMRKKSPTRKNA